MTERRTVRAGFDEAFLGVATPLPRAERELRRLDYTHFTVLLDPVRRLAAATAVGIDGGALVDVPRGDDWHLDSRVPAQEQAGAELYANNDLDRGHLVRRRDPVWGDAATAEQANFDTFAYPNAAPQASDFNQGRQLWVGLEDHVLDYAQAHRHRIVVFTGTVLEHDDPVYRGVAIPRSFWKVAAWVTSGDTGAKVLRAAGFVLDQSPQLDRLELPLRPGTPPPLGPFRTFQVPIAGIAGLTGLGLGPLPGADVLAPAERAAERQHWRRLTAMEDVRL